MKKKLKYQVQIDAVPNCPPMTAERKDIVVFRAFNKKKKDNFLPQFIETPKRRNDYSSKDTKHQCMGYGLSVWGNYMRARDNAVRFDLGHHIAKVPINKDHGFITKPNRNKHMTLYEDEDAVFEDFELMEIENKKGKGTVQKMGYTILKPKEFKRDTLDRLIKQEDLIYCDGPLLSSHVHEDTNQLYASLWRKLVEGRLHRWWVFETTEEELKRLVHISEEDTLATISNREIYEIEVDHELNLKKVYRITY